MTSRLLEKSHDPAAFRQAVRDWLKTAIPRDWRERIRQGGEASYINVQKEWYAAMTEAGLATAHWPAAWGGADLPLEALLIFFQEQARADAPVADLFTVSLYHLPATLMTHGSAAQQETYVEGVRTGGKVWCQGFSEPGAGSDLASLQTRAERKGDRYVINGQKIWTSYARHADYCLLLARTDRDAKRKHDGISYFILDMRAAGLDIRPIRMITGEAEFNEVFLDDVEIPVENLIGVENEGWRIAQSTLTAERGLLIFEQMERLANSYAHAAREGRQTWARDAVLARDFAAFHPRIRAIQSMVMQLIAEIQAGSHGNALATYVKLYSAILLQDFKQFMARAAGLSGQVQEAPLHCVGYDGADPTYGYMRSFAWSISGGSNEIMRNIISERLLELPR